MELQLVRFASQPGDVTVGALYHERRVSLAEGMIRREFLCFTLEDEYRDVKVAGHTRIPEGRYEIKLRQVGGFHRRYAEKFGSIHKGMLWLQNVPGFDFILIHMGNDADDTAGCILLGDIANPRAGTISSSAFAYKRVYPLIASRLFNLGEQVWISVEDFTRG